MHERVDGWVAVVVARMDPSPLRFEQHKKWVVSAHLQGGSHQHVVSGSTAGDILWWDTRFPGQAVRNLTAFRLKQSDSMRTMVRRCMHVMHSCMHVM